MKKNQETGEISNIRYFSKLTFCYKFKEEDRDKVVTFAYAVPYGYTDLVKDLEQVRNNLMSMSHAVYTPISKEDYVHTGDNMDHSPQKVEQHYSSIGAQGQG